MYIFNEVYERNVNPGDYIIFNVNKYHGMSHMVMVRVNDNSSLISNISYSSLSNPNDLDSYLNNKNLSDSFYNLYCYKIENLDIESLISFNNGYVTDVLQRNSFDFEGDIYDIFGRQICLGDFVFFVEENRELNKKNIKYGMVIDKNYVFTDKGILKKVRASYKITAPIDIEKRICRNILENYKLLQQNMISSKNTDFFEKRKRGDVFRYNNNLYVYVGTSVYNVNYNNNKISIFSNSVIDKINQNVDLFFRIDIKTNKGRELFSGLQKNIINQEDITNYIIESGLTHYYPFGNPRVYKFDLSKKRAGDYIGHINFDFNLDSSFNLSYSGNGIINDYFV